MENNNYNGLNVINPNRTRYEHMISNSTRQRNIPKQSGRSKKRKNKSSMLKRRLVFAGAAISLGAVSVNIIDAATKYFEEQKIVSNTLEEYNTIVKENTHVLTDENGKPIYNGTEVMFMIDTSNIGHWIADQLEQGENEAAVVYGVYSNLPASTEIENNFSDILDAANLSVDWAIENGYTGMNDKNLKKDVRQEYLDEYYNINSDEKKMGGI